MPPPSNRGDNIEAKSWTEYRIFVVNSLETIKDDVDELKKDFTGIKIKVAVFGGVAGLVGGSIPILVDILLRWKEISGR